MRRLKRGLANIIRAPFLLVGFVAACAVIVCLNFMCWLEAD